MFCFLFVTETKIHVPWVIFIQEFYKYEFHNYTHCVDIERDDFFGINGPLYGMLLLLLYNITCNYLMTKMYLQKMIAVDNFFSPSKHNITSPFNFDCQFYNCYIMFERLAFIVTFVCFFFREIIDYFGIELDAIQNDFLIA